MLSKVREAISKFNMLDETECVTVGLSGGADSVALLYTMKELGYNVHAVHVNHQLRGEESQRDENFVREICRKENIPLEVFRVDVKGEAKKRSIGLEECGRELRYEIFSKEAEKNGGKIATAHTLSDNAETVLMNIARGCALAGLTGIPPVRGNIIRPLIFAERKDIERYCCENNLSFVTDSSNLTDDYARNRIRHNTVPSLKTINPSFEQAICRLTELVSWDEDFIEESVSKAKKLKKQDCYNIDDLKDLHRSILSRLLISEYSDAAGAACSYLHVQRMLKLIEKGEGREELPKGVFVVVRKGKFSIESKKEEYKEFIHSIKIPCVFGAQGKTLILEEISRDTYDELKKNDRYLFKNAFDCDIISSNLVVRNRRGGDRLKQVGRGVTKELRRLMSEKGIPANERDNILVLADDSGVIWAQGFGVDERFAVSEKTKNVVVIKVYDRS